MRRLTGPMGWARSPARDGGHGDLGDDQRLDAPRRRRIEVVARLVNNDADDGTSVVVRGVEFVPTATAPPTARRASRDESLRHR